MEIWGLWSCLFAYSAHGGGLTLIFSDFIADLGYW